MSDTAFARAFEILVGHEGAFCNERDDPGNWTGNAVGSGEQRGTKFGISAGSYPTLDIAALTLDAAQQIYRRDYWDRVQADALPPPLALLVFDAAVNNGVGRGVIWLQRAVGAAPDGALGPSTLAAVSAYAAQHGGAALCAEFQAQRLAFMAALPTWPIFGLGWARRLCELPYQAMTMTGD